MHSITQLKKLYPLQYTANNPILREVCEEVKKITPEIKELYQALHELVREYEWVGLAAPQIGKNIRMAAVTQRDMSKKKRKLLQEIILINPVIIGSSSTTEIAEEWCLSLPWVLGNVERPDEITIKYMDIKGKSHILKSSGYNARIILHEMDHLDGVLFIDKLA